MSFKVEARGRVIRTCDGCGKIDEKELTTYNEVIGDKKFFDNWMTMNVRLSVPTNMKDGDLRLSRLLKYIEWDFELCEECFNDKNMILKGVEILRGALEKVF